MGRQRPDTGRRKFTLDEDDHLRHLVLEHGNHDWVKVASQMPGRSPRQCRHRYKNYLIDTHECSAWTIMEEQILIDKYRELGPKWVQIATFIPGRTGNDVKNRWHKHLLKRDPSLTRILQKDEEAVLLPHLCGSWRDLNLSNGSPDAATPELSPFLQFVLNRLSK
jgi:hypothetical protein